jgi:hypothetical protein
MKDLKARETTEGISLLILGAFAKFRKAKMNIVMSVRYLSIFRKSVVKIQVSLNSHNNNGHFT